MSAALGARSVNVGVFRSQHRRATAAPLPRSRHACVTRSSATDSQAVEDLEKFSKAVNAKLGQHASTQAQPFEFPEEEQPPAPAGLLELQHDTFWPYLEEAGDELVVVDFFTDWCGPCKMIYPELVKLSQQVKDQQVRIVKFNCNKQNKELGKTLAIKVAPTFHLYRNKTKVGEMTGAKVEKLRTLISEQQVAAGKAAL